MPTQTPPPRARSPHDTAELSHCLLVPAARPGPAALPAVPGYHVERELARGGMGRVLAGRELALGREVAIKLLLPGSQPERFLTEARITARLPHPNIPPVYALGELDDGSPFLAMKLVRGRTLMDEQQGEPPPADRLPRLVQAFEGVCQAVGYAHAHGVLHRDLKPANVMVGAFGEVQLMDWGLAKEIGDDTPETGGRMSGEAGLTQAGEVVGTPAYMAPEQAYGTRLDPRTDVFALGCVLTVLLTGRPVYEGDVAEVLLAAAAANTVAARGRLARCGADPELVALANECLAADPAARPADGQAVAARVAAYRAGVEARLRAAETDRATAAEAQKRRRVTRVAAGLVAAALLAGTGVSVAQAVRAWQAERAATAARDEAVGRQRQEQDARQEADRQARAAVAAKEFLQSVLVQGSVDNQAAAGAVKAEVPLREALDRADKTIAGKFADQPLIESDLRFTIGDAYASLGRYAESDAQHSTALKLREATLGPDAPLTIKSVGALAYAKQAAGDLAAAAALYRRALAAWEASAGPDDPQTLTLVNNVAHVSLLAGDLATAEAYNRRAADTRERTLGPDHAETLLSLNQLAHTLHIRGDRAADALFRRVLAGRERVLGPDHPNTLGSVNDVAAVFQRAGDHAAAEAMFRRAADGFAAALGPDHPRAINALANVGVMAVVRGDHAAAEPVFRRAAEQIERRQFRLPNAARHLSNYADCLTALGREADAGRWLHNAALAAERGGPGTAASAADLVRVGTQWLNLRRWAEAEPVLRRAVEVRQARAAGPKPEVSAGHVAAARLLFARALSGQRKYTEAEPVLRAGFDGLAAINSPALGTAADRLVVLYTRLGRPDEATKWRAERAKHPAEVAPRPRPAGG